MTDARNSIKDVIEQQIGNGDWNGIAVDDGRYEGNLDTLDVDSDTIEFEEIDLESGTITVIASGLGSVTHKDADGNEVSGEYDIKVTAKVNINIGSALVLGVSNED